MQRDILFLLNHDFSDGPGQSYYCPECAQLIGVLAYYPALRDLLDVRQVDVRRPRQAVVDLIGASNQGCPVLVIASTERAALSGITVSTHDDVHFVSGATAIGHYLSRVYEVGRPH